MAISLSKDSRLKFLELIVMFPREFQLLPVPELAPTSFQLESTKTLLGEGTGEDPTLDEEERFNATS
ncbi:hypothetical protein FOCC_FOCC012828 [Frankliniella occidentalis]|nr:hypothetical protein FOCC_FOCC012828 [Frankliniella occidentalis]